MAATKYYTTAEAADVLGLSQIRVKQFCAEGRLGRKIGRHYAITLAQLRKFQAIERRPGRPRRIEN